MSTNVLASCYQKRNEEYIKGSERYQNLSEEEKRCQYGCDLYKNLLGNGKPRLDDYRKSIMKFVKVSCNSFSSHL